MSFMFNSIRIRSHQLTDTNYASNFIPDLHLILDYFHAKSIPQRLRGICMDAIYFPLVESRSWRAYDISNYPKHSSIMNLQVKIICSVKCGRMRSHRERKHGPVNRSRTLNSIYSVRKFKNRVCSRQNYTGVFARVGVLIWSERWIGFDFVAFFWCPVFV